MLGTPMHAPPTAPDAAIRRAFEGAMQAHAAGDAPKAEALYKLTLRLAPGHADAWHQLGRLVHAHGNYLPALECVEKAISLKPRVGEYQASFGLILLALGRAEAALEATSRAMRATPGSASVLIAHGQCLAACGQRAEALKMMRRAVAREPGHVDAQMQLGVALALSGEPAQALAPLRAARRLAPGSPEAAYNLGCTLRDAGREEEAIAEFRAALALRPDYPEAANNLALALTDRAPAEAEDVLRQAMAARPGQTNAAINLARHLTFHDRLDEAAALLRQVRAQEPGLAADTALANALRNCAAGDAAALAEAEALGRAAVAAFPEQEPARICLAMTLMLQGQYEEAWPHFSYRPERAYGLRRFVAPRPVWDGAALAGTLLVYDEQGAGDLLQMARYLPLAAARVGRLVVQAPAGLCALLARMPGVAAALPAAPGEAMPESDAVCPDIDLPGIFAGSAGTMAPSVPYLQADPALQAAWRGRIAGLPGRRVGLAWAGNPAYAADRHRSLKAEALLALAGTAGVSFVALQPGGTAPAPLGAWDAAPLLTDYDETAALISVLDLVVAVDTGVAHLAGALGKPVWLLNRYAPDWRWGLQTRDSAWYPTLRQFRQAAPGDWGDVLRAVRAALEDGAAPGPRGLGQPG